MKPKYSWFYLIAIIGLLLIFTIGCEKDDLVKLASLSTLPITEITFNTAKSGGNITNDGGASVTSRGVVWSTLENPDFSDNEGITQGGRGPGGFTSELEDLLPATIYFVRAYATNIKGTAYGQQESFETPTEHSGNDGQPCPGMPNFTDERDGNVYNTVQIGGQCWLKENLRYLPAVSPSSAGSYSDPHYYVYGYQGTSVSEAIATANYQNYGVLYNWPTAMNGASSSSANPSGIQGVCPADWHLPSDAEWSQLTNYLNDEHGIPNTNTVDGAGNALKSCRQVGSPLGGECATSEHPSWNAHSTHYGTDQFGFSALPVGHRSTNGFHNLGYSGRWWSSTETTSAHAWRRHMDFNYGAVYSDRSVKELGFSVRCVRVID